MANITETPEGRAMLRRVEEQAEAARKHERRFGTLNRLATRMHPARLTLPVFPVRLVLPTVPEAK